MAPSIHSHLKQCEQHNTLSNVLVGTGHWLALFIILSTESLINAMHTDNQ